MWILVETTAARCGKFDDAMIDYSHSAKPSFEREKSFIDLPHADTRSNLDSFKLDL